MLNEDPLGWFDPLKPFYPLVLNYLGYIVGFQDLFYRGGGLQYSDSFEELYQGLDPGTTFSADARLGSEPPEPLWVKALPSDMPREARENLLSQRWNVDRLMAYAAADSLGAIELPSKLQPTSLRVRLNDVARHVPGGGRGLVEEWVRAGGFMLILAYETTDSYHEEGRDSGPLWEFLRHCRNAAAHGGAMTFRGNQPRFPARWGPIEIERSMQGMPLIAFEGSDGLLGRADPIFLLRDIEDAFFGPRLP